MERGCKRVILDKLSKIGNCPRKRIQSDIREECSMLVLILLITSTALVYFGSCVLHPYIACETCAGTARHRGGLFTKATRPCHACSGTGQKLRHGAAVLGRGKRRKSTSRIAPRTSSIKDKSQAG